MVYLRNAWYVAAWPHELHSDRVLARTILEAPVALFRLKSGTPVAVLDRCPHRFAPLSAGQVRDDLLVCRYHGLGFDSGGTCRHNPHGPIPKRLEVRSFPIVELHRTIWIWMGEAEKADPTLIPDLSYLSAAPDSAFSCGYLWSSGHYELLVDNLMDLSHTDYLHPDTLGGMGITGTRQQIEERAEYIEVTWFSPNTRPSALLQSIFPSLPDQTDMVQRIRWFAPGVMKLTAATMAAGAPEEQALANFNAHCVTPESATTSHYFFAATRNYATGNAELNARLATAREKIFATEDKPMIESIQRRMGTSEFWSLCPMLLPIDAAPVRTRRRMQQLIAGEAANSRPADASPES